jgi:hypothetical protein
LRGRRLGRVASAGPEALPLAGGDPRERASGLPAGFGRGVQADVDRYQPPRPVVKPVEDQRSTDDHPREMVELVDHQRVRVAGGQSLEHPL